VVRKRGSAPKGGAHSTVGFAYTASETLESCFVPDNLLMVWQSTPKVVPRIRISRSAAPFSYAGPSRGASGYTGGARLARVCGVHV